MRLITAAVCFGLLLALAPAASADADSDGLSDEYELTIGTDPFDPDTDNDGRQDGEEVNGATNPLVAFTHLGQWLWSADITFDLRATIFDDEEVIQDDGSSPPLAIDVGDLPEKVDLVAFHPNDDGTLLFAVDTTVRLPNNLIVTPREVILADNSEGRWTYSVRFDGAAAGLPYGAGIDAITLDGAGDLVLSFDITVELPGKLRVDDEDLVIWDTVGFTMYLDGTAAGMAEELDVDAIHLLGNGHLLVSFDTEGRFMTIRFDDNDLMEYDTALGTWELNRALEGPDLDALAATAAPEFYCADGSDNDFDGPIDCDDDDCIGPSAPDLDSDGLIACDGDCDDLNGEIWGTPGEVRELRLGPSAMAPGLTELSWLPPEEPGGSAIVYDTLLSTTRDSFLRAICVEWDDGFDTSAFHGEAPDPGEVFYFLVRAENACPDGQGTLGFGELGEREGPACP